MGIISKGAGSPARLFRSLNILTHSCEPFLNATLIESWHVKLLGLRARHALSYKTEDSDRRHE
jgi:hypothetical protein